MLDIALVFLLSMAFYMLLDSLIRPRHPRSRRGQEPGCRWHQCSDQAVCDDCALTWDINDPRPPHCKVP